LANSLGAYVMSKDEDFSELVVRGLLQTGVIWVHLGNTDQRRLWASIQPLLGTIAKQVRDGAKVIHVPFELD
jgi:predicted nuclease of predicted toxin-antitoxin system